LNMRRIASIIMLLVAATAGIALAAEPVTQPTAGMSLADYLGSVPAIILFTMGIVEVFKLVLMKYRLALTTYKLEWLTKLPTPLMAIGIAVGLTFLANYVIKTLPGDPLELIWQAIVSAAAAGGFFTWLREPTDSPARKADSAGGVALPMSRKASFLLLGLLLPLVLTSGCVGTQTLSPSQQYGIASASVRAAADSIRTAGENGLISDEDIIAIDPVVRQAFDSLRSMRTAILEGDPITVQWYLIQVQGLVSKLSTMQLRAKEMNDGSNGSVSIDSNHSGHQRPYGPDYRPARGERRQARLYARRTRNGRSAKRQERKRLVRLRRRREGKAGWRDGTPAPGEPLVSREVEWD